MVKVIKINKYLSELCHCILPNLNSNLNNTFNQHRVNCFLKNEFKYSGINIDCNVILYVKNYPSDLENVFLKNIHYSYLYRQQQQISLPFLEGNLHEKHNLSLYIDFLLMEYFNTSVPDPDKFSAISNPFFDHQNIFSCLNKKFPLFLHNKHIIVLPFIV